MVEEDDIVLAITTHIAMAYTKVEYRGKQNETGGNNTRGKNEKIANCKFPC